MEASNELKLYLDNPGNASQFAIVLDHFTKQNNIVLFRGEMGSGKTTLIKAFCKAKGVESGLGSPTYSLVNEYETNQGEHIYHFDLYRIKDEAEALDIGWEEYMASGNICLIEWPEKVENLLPLDHCDVLINVTAGGRVVTIRNY